MRIGSICSGIGMLDVAVAEVLPGASVAWHCETDPDAATVLAHHWPDTPNHGDLTQLDWCTVEPVDIITAGYPCQPFSSAGKRKGTRDERHLWPHVREAIRVLRPRFTFLENVSGHRALGFDRVLGDLAALGLHVRWTSLRASDLGYCHRRERLFIVVTDPDRDSVWQQSEPEPGRERSALAGFTSPVAISVARGVGQQLLPTPRATDGTKGGPNQRGSSGDLMLPSAVLRLLPTPTASDGERDDCPSERRRNSPSLVSLHHLLPTPTARLGSSRGAADPAARKARSKFRSGELDEIASHVISLDWGPYAAAIARQEAVCGPAPSPVEPNMKGNPRLAAAFPEWMMGVPAGWVTDHLGRNAALRCLGNTVVVDQAVAAYRTLLALRLREVA